MYQVMGGLVPTFQITLPEAYLQLLQEISIWEINLPLDCVLRIDFIARLAFRTLWPLAAASAFFVASSVLRRRFAVKLRREKHEEKARVRKKEEPAGGGVHAPRGNYSESREDNEIKEHGKSLQDLSDWQSRTVTFAKASLLVAVMLLPSPTSLYIGWTTWRLLRLQMTSLTVTVVSEYRKRLIRCFVLSMTWSLFLIVMCMAAMGSSRKRLEPLLPLTLIVLRSYSHNQTAVSP